MAEFTPQKVFTIEDLETLRVMADPLRAQIYEILIPEPATVRQVGERLGTAVGRLYYHFNMMEKLNLLRVVETRMVANMAEKVYRAAAYELEIHPRLLNFATDEGKEALNNALTGPIDATRDDLLRSIQARLFALDQGAAEKERSVLLNRTTARIADTDAEEFHRRLGDLIAEFTAKDQSSQAGEERGADKGQNYALLIAFYPSFYYQKED